MSEFMNYKSVVVTFLLFFIVADCANGDDPETIALLDRLSTFVRYKTKKDKDGTEYIIKLRISKSNPGKSGKRGSLEALLHLDKLSHLAALEIGGDSLVDEDLKLLPPLPNLEELAIQASKITDEGLKYFASMKNLKKLIIRCNHVHGSGLGYLKDFSKLECLETVSTPFDNSAIPPIVANFKNLRRLSIVNGTVTPNGVMQLADLHWLHQVYLPDDMLGRHPVNRANKEARTQRPQGRHRPTEAFYLKYVRSHYASRLQAASAGEKIPPDRQYPFAPLPEIEAMIRKNYAVIAPKSSAANSEEGWTNYPPLSNAPQYKKKNAQMRRNQRLTRSARNWTLPDGTRLKAKTITENECVVLLGCDRLYSQTSFSGKLLFRISRLEKQDRQIAKRLHDNVPRIKAVALPGDLQGMKVADVETTISLTQISLGLANYASEYGKFPQRAIYSDNGKLGNGKPLLSWRVRILPYMGEMKLYEEFHLNESWDSPHNQKLIEKIPHLYAPTNTPVNGNTRYLAPINQGAMWKERGGLPWKGFSDGTTYTIAVVQAASKNAVPWTKPMDIEFNPQSPRSGLVEPNAKGFFVGFADGHAAFLQNELEISTLNAYFTPSGGEAAPRQGL